MIDKLNNDANESYIHITFETVANIFQKVIKRTTNNFLRYKNIKMVCNLSTKYSYLFIYIYIYNTFFFFNIITNKFYFTFFLFYINLYIYIYNSFVKL